MNKTELVKRCATPQEINLIYGLDVGTLANYRSQRRGPRFFKVGRRVFYFLADVEEWICRNPVLTVDCVEMTSPPKREQHLNGLVTQVIRKIL